MTAQPAKKGNSRKAIYMGIILILVLVIAVVAVLAFVDYQNSRPSPSALAITRSILLYHHGLIIHGWGFSMTNVTNPGPTIVVEQGDNVSLTIFCLEHGDTSHRFLLSYTNKTSFTPGDVQSPIFYNSLINFSFTVTNTVGTSTYMCTFDGEWGYFQVVPTGTLSP